MTMPSATSTELRSAMMVLAGVDEIVARMSAVVGGSDRGRLPETQIDELDLARMQIELAVQESAYRSALSTSERLLPAAVLAFLR